MKLCWAVLDCWLIFDCSNQNFQRFVVIVVSQFHSIYLVHWADFSRRNYIHTCTCYEKNVFFLLANILIVNVFLRHRRVSESASAISTPSRSSVINKSQGEENRSDCVKDSCSRRTDSKSADYYKPKSKSRSPTRHRGREERHDSSHRHRELSSSTVTRHRRSPPHRARSPRQSSRQSSCARDIIKTRVDKAKQRLRESVAREIVDKSSSHLDYKTRRSTARDSSPNRKRNKPVTPIKSPFKSPHKSRTTSSAKSKFQSPKKSKLETPKKSSLKSPRKSQTNSHHKPQDSKAASSSQLNEASGAYEEDSISDLYELKQSLLHQLSSSEIGRAHVWTPVTWNDLVCRLLLEKKKQNNEIQL